MEGRYRGLLEAAPDAMVVVDETARSSFSIFRPRSSSDITATSCSARRSQHHPVGFAERLIPDSTRTAAEALAQQIGTGIELTAVRKDGSVFPIELMLSPWKAPRGSCDGGDPRHQRTQDGRAAAQTMALQMAHSAEHDFLTGLPNRMLLNDRVGQAIALAPRHSNKVAVLFLDLDGFKHINDSLGHPIGDKLLQSIAGRLVDCVRGSDTVSRQGGDEFVVLLSEVDRWRTRRSWRADAAAVRGTHTIDQQDLHITASIGISIYPDDGQDAETLIKNADTAMYQAKEKGRQSYQFFKPAMNVRAVERQSIEESLRRALERQELVAALPAEDRSEHRRDHRCGSADPLESSHARPRPSVAVHLRSRKTAD